MSKKTKFIDAKRRGFMQGSIVAGGAVATGAVDAATDDLVEEAAPAKNTGHADALIAVLFSLSQGTTIKLLQFSVGGDFQ